MIVGLAGYARSGKDTAAEVFVQEGFTRLAFADLLKEFVYRINPYIVDEGAYGVVHRLTELVDSEGGWETAKHYQEVRRLLQVTGTEAARRLLGEDVWVNALFNKIVPGEDYVITDVRMENECNAIAESRGILLWVHREGVGPANDHATENSLSEYDCNFVLDNSGSIEEFQHSVRGLLKELLITSRGKHS
jgi:hypothetical protein